MRRAAAGAVDVALEALVVPSFTRIGYHVRRRLEGWRDLDRYDLEGRVMLITGATSGIGLAAAEQLARCGATLVLLGRDAEKTARVCAELAEHTGNARLSTAVADMGDYGAVRRAAESTLARHDRLDVLIHNAGALSERRTEAPDGTEATIASQVVGPFLLTGLLLERLASSGRGRVLTMSSGGMYTVPPTVEGLELDPADYRGARQYALAKRAQVTLNAQWAGYAAGRNVRFHALHPGWVATPGLSASLPGFARLMRPVLRSPAEGADTLVWLAADDGMPLRTTGQFWLDRRPRRIHRLPATRRADTPERRRALWQWCAERSGWSAAERGAAGV